MPRPAAAAHAPKPGLHPRNRHRERYDFAALAAHWPALARFIQPTGFGDVSLDFADPAAVLALNQALLRTYYGIIEWSVPDGYLCPPIPGRADYLHHVAELLAPSECDGAARPPSPAVRPPSPQAPLVLDVGVGASCIYPILGVHEYGWRFVGAEVDPVALQHARGIVAAHPHLRSQVELRAQPDPGQIFRGIIRPGEQFALVVCNPPFHASAAEAAASTQRKLRQLAGGTAPPRSRSRGGSRVTAPAAGTTPRFVRNFGGQAHELWCDGGEVGFVRRMIAESVAWATAVDWFTVLLSQGKHLRLLESALARAAPGDVRTIPLVHGQKQARILAWRFSPPLEKTPAPAKGHLPSPVAPRPLRSTTKRAPG